MDHEEKRFTCALIAASLPVCLLVSQESGRGSETLGASHVQTDVGPATQRVSRTRPGGFIQSLPCIMIRLGQWGRRSLRQVCNVNGARDRKTTK
ncbi:hypothetical protein [Paraburkholderia nodosa]|uniref:hypothetical protein n=1 Tax=Paraburkholderia nodosa TaxID=392320 RepID=UPI0012B69E6A|nr:hypothetical protein [Paraburkholderia nodosa]